MLRLRFRAKAKQPNAVKQKKSDSQENCLAWLRKRREHPHVDETRTTINKHCFEHVNQYKEI